MFFKKKSLNSFKINKNNQSNNNSSKIQKPIKVQNYNLKKKSIKKI